MCRRRCKSSKASLGGRALKKLVDCGRWMVALNACVLLRSPPVEVSFWTMFLRVGTNAHLYRCSRRSKGKSIAGRSPLAGTRMLLTLLKTVSTWESCQNWSTEMRVSLKVGTHRTFRIKMGLQVPRWSRASAGRSPMHLTAWGLPSMPVMVSLHGRVLIRSSACG